jgi:hypothetical protein
VVTSLPEGDGVRSAVAATTASRNRERDDRSDWRQASLLHGLCVTPNLIESAPVSIVRDLVSIGIADRGVRSSND